MNEKTGTVESKPTSEGARTWLDKTGYEVVRDMDQWSDDVPIFVSTKSCTFVSLPVLMEEFAASLRSQLAAADKEREKAKRSREHTWEWIASHYGKLEDWARKILPEPHQTQFFNCIANGVWDVSKDRGEPYMSVGAGMIHPSGYFKMETAQEQLLFDHMKRAEAAESELQRLRERITELEGLLRKLLEVSPVKACVGGVCDHSTCQHKWATEIEAERLLAELEGSK